MSNSCKIYTHHGFLTVLTTILTSDLDYVMSSCKVKKKKIVTPISVKQISSLDFSRLSQMIYSLHSKLLKRLQRCNLQQITIIFDTKEESNAFHREPMKLAQINHVIWQRSCRHFSPAIAKKNSPYKQVNLQHVGERTSLDTCSQWFGTSFCHIFRYSKQVLELTWLFRDLFYESV